MDQQPQQPPSPPNNQAMPTPQGPHIAPINMITPSTPPNGTTIGVPNVATPNSPPRQGILATPGSPPRARPQRVFQITELVSDGRVSDDEL